MSFMNSSLVKQSLNSLTDKFERAPPPSSACVSVSGLGTDVKGKVRSPSETIYRLLQHLKSQHRLSSKINPTGRCTVRASLADLHEVWQMKTWKTMRRNKDFSDLVYNISPTPPHLQYQAVWRFSSNTSDLSYFELEGTQKPIQYERGSLEGRSNQISSNRFADHHIMLSLKTHIHMILSVH